MATTLLWLQCLSFHLHRFIILLQHPLPHKSSAITGFFPSHYRLLTLLHHMFAHRGYPTFPPWSRAFSPFLPLRLQKVATHSIGTRVDSRLPATEPAASYFPVSRGVGRRYFHDCHLPLHLMFAHHGIGIGLIPVPRDDQRGVEPESYGMGYLGNEHQQRAGETIGNE